MTFDVLAYISHVLPGVLYNTPGRTCGLRPTVPDMEHVNMYILAPVLTPGSLAQPTIIKDKCAMCVCVWSR